MTTPDPTGRLEQARSTWITVRSMAKVARRAPRLTPWASVNPASLCRRWATETPYARALVFEDEIYSWKQLDERANRYASYFQGRGIRAGDVVALMMDNRPDFLFALMGLSRLGAVGALINTNLVGKPLVHVLEVAKAKKVLAGGEHVDAVAAVLGETEGLSATGDLWVQLEHGEGEACAGRVINADVEAASGAPRPGEHRPRNSETFCFIYTSGTTGLPKAARITNQRMMAAATVFGEVMVENGPGETIYVSLPLYHSSAIYIGYGSALTTGGCIALRRKFSASKFWGDVVKHDATAILYIGELCRYLLNTPPVPEETQHRVRVAVGNGLRPDIWGAFQERFRVPLVREFYGATEGNVGVMNIEGRPGRIGRKLPGFALVRCEPTTGEVIRDGKGFCQRIEPGEAGLLLGRISPVLKFDGYVDEKATRKKVLADVFRKGDRYFNTGDLIQLHEGGWLSFADRIGDTFRWKGENVSTNEVAELLNAVDGVLEANVYGVAVPHHDGKAGMAALNVTDAFDLEALARYVAETMPKYQRPYFLRILSGEMRTTGTFKHQKVDYREEGFDPATIDDPLYLLEGERYVPLDAALHARIDEGDVTL